MQRALLHSLAFLFLSQTLVFAADFRLTPAVPRQGDLLEVFGPPAARQVRFREKTIPLYPEPNSPDLVGLMPVPVKTPPGVYKLEWLDEHGAPIHTQEIRVSDAHFVIQNVQLPPALAELHSTNDERDQVSQFFETESPIRYWQLPIRAPLRGCLTSFFGVQRALNGKLTGDIHAGVDQRGAMGTPIHAVAAGQIRIGGQYALHGGTVGIDHGQGLKSMYLHMSKIAVKPGDRVDAGDVIGFVGSTGRSTGPHLHWALYAQGEPVNPLQWLRLQPCPRKTTPAKPKKS